MSHKMGFYLYTKNKITFFNISFDVTPYVDILTCMSL